VCYRVQLGVESVLGSVLESVLRSVLESVLRADLGAYGQAGWECAIEFNQERTWERAMKCIWQLAFKFVVCNVMYSIQRTKSHAYHCNLVNM
jgi:hypothetical protein